jgi:YVTN family beta-propeller protein
MVTDPRLGSEFAGYRIESLVGRGGMGVVYLAEHLRLRRKAALKLIVPDLAEDPKFRERFLKESELAASLEHPNILPIYDAGEVAGTLYIAMRFIEGIELKSLIDRDGPLEPARAVSVVSQVAAALDAAHERGLIHRDVKSANILLASPGTPKEHAFLTDFGLTKRLSSDSGITATGQFVGTLDYAAPEQFEGKSLDARTDVYSLGCVLYECLTGEIPFRADTQAALVYAHLLKTPPKPSKARQDLPAAIDDVIAIAMSKKPEDRYPSAGALADAVGAQVEAPVRSAIPGRHAPGRPSTFVRNLRRKQWIPAAVLVAAGGVIAAMLVLSGGGNHAAPGGRIAPGAQGTASGAARLVRFDLATKNIAASIPIGKSPAALTVGEGSVWVANSGAGTVSRIDPVTNKVTGTIRVGKGPEGIAFDRGSVWVANRLSNTISVIDPGSNRVVATIPVPSSPATVAAGDGAVLVGRGAGVGGLLRIDEVSRGITQASVPVAFIDFTVVVSEGQGVGWGGGDIGTLVKIDLATGRDIGHIDTGQPVAGMAVGREGVWVATDGLPAVVRLVDPSSGKVTATVPVGSTRHEAIWLVEENGSLWVTNADDGTISQVDLGSKRVVHAYDVGQIPTGIATGFGAVWVTVSPSP